MAPLLVLISSPLQEKRKKKSHSGSTGQNCYCKCSNSDRRTEYLNFRGVYFSHLQNLPKMLGSLSLRCPVWRYASRSVSQQHSNRPPPSSSQHCRLADGADIPARHLDSLARTSCGRGLVLSEISGLASSTLSRQHAYFCRHVK